LYAQLAAVCATGNRAVLADSAGARTALDRLPPHLAARLHWTRNWPDESFDVVLFGGGGAAAQDLRRRLAQRPGARIAVLRPVDGAYPLERLVAEQVIATNTAAAGGNANLLLLR
jgi:RHH-type proline utilization regulon transcriptional repressor/proline dehydrogenase/delta 1-pyrroline-5-carboxylate dehydrogenase